MLPTDDSAALDRSIGSNPLRRSNDPTYTGSKTPPQAPANSILMCHLLRKVTNHLNELLTLGRTLHTLNNQLTQRLTASEATTILQDLGPCYVSNFPRIDGLRLELNSLISQAALSDEDADVEKMLRKTVELEQRVIETYLWGLQKLLEQLEMEDMEDLVDVLRGLDLQEDKKGAIDVLKESMEKLVLRDWKAN